MVVATNCQACTVSLHVEWCGEGGTHFLVELALRSSALRERDAAAVWGYHAELGTFIQSPGELAPQQLNWRGGARGGAG